MCFSSPPDPASPPKQAPPPEEKRLELNPDRKKSKTRKINQAGTRQLRIPLGGASGGSGSNNSLYISR